MQTRKVLSIDGGGARGKLPAVLCAKLEESIGPLHKAFDMVVGTSTGGIIASCIATKMQATKVAELYATELPNIFSRNRLRGLQTLWGLWGPKYTSTGLELALKRYMGDLRLSDASIELVMTTYDLNSMDSYFFKSHRAKITSSRDIELWRACMATSAAPTYFEPVEYRNYSFVDGGVHSNNPSLCAYAEALKLWPNDNIKVLSIGTGGAPNNHTYGTRWGIMDWVSHIVPVFMSSSDATVGFQVNSILNKNLYRIKPNYISKPDDASPANLAGMEREALRLWDAQQNSILEFLGPNESTETVDTNNETSNT